MSQLNNLSSGLFIFFFVAILSSCSKQEGSSSQQDASPPVVEPFKNVLFIFTDDQRRDTVNALGNKQISTPNIDTIAKQGVSFSQAAIMGSMNGAVCSPSRAMLMTGRPLFKIDPTGNFIDPDFVTLPEYLRSKGFHTFYTGKWHNDKASFARSFSSADNIFFGGMSDHYKVPLHAFDPEGEYASEKAYFIEKKHSTEIYSNAAVDFLQSYQSENPFFAFVSLQAPHDPRQVPDEFGNDYQPDHLTLPPNFMPEHPFANGELDIRDEWTAHSPRKTSDVKKHLAKYYGMISHIDFHLGRILQALEETGKANETLIVFAGDNGLALGQHGLMGKQNLYEHSIGVPLMFAGSGLEAAMSIDAPAYLYDAYPTIVELLGLDIPASVDGLSFASNLRDKTEPAPRSSTVHAYKNFQRAIIKDDFKYIVYNVKGESREQLFNLREDPYETINLVSQPKHESLVKFLKDELQKGLARSGDAVDLSAKNWGVPVIDSWVDYMKKNEPAQLINLRNMAREERESF